MLYNPPSGSTDANAPFVGKNVAGGTQGSKVPPAAVEYPQREVVAMIAASGQAPTNNVLVQAAIALGRGIWVDNLTGAGDLAVATLGVVLPSFMKGMRIGGVATAANTVTNPKLRVVNLGSVGGYTDFPILKEDGSALAVGEIKAGRRYRYEADGAGNVLITGGGIGSAGATLQALQITGGRLWTRNAAGTYTFTVPSDCGPFILIETWGAGGAGGGSSGSGAAGTGGAGGGYAQDVRAVTPGQALTIVVGAAGVAGNPSTGGGTTSVSGLASPLYASGGGGGVYGNGGAQQTQPAFGGGTGGRINLPGRYGGVGIVFGSGIVAGGFGGGSGYLGASAEFGLQTGVPGYGPGGGGSGGANGYPGGAGTDGQVKITY